MATNIQISGLPETTSIASTDYLHVKKTDGVDYKIKQSASAVIGIQDTAANLATSNPILLTGQWAKETDTGVIKCGDGTTAYNYLLAVGGQLLIFPTVVTSTFTAKLGYLYFVDTSLSAFSVNLPSPTKLGDTFTLVDYSGTFNTNKLTSVYATNRIDGYAENMILDVVFKAYKFVWSGTTKGWRII